MLAIEDDEPALLEGIKFGLKSFHEAERIRTADNAEFTIALLYGKLASKTKYHNAEYVSNAIKWFDQAINNYKRNPKYVQNILEDRLDSKNWFHQLCEHLKYGTTDIQYLNHQPEVRRILGIYEMYHPAK